MAAGAKMMAKTAPDLLELTLWWRWPMSTHHYLGYYLSVKKEGLGRQNHTAREDSYPCFLLQSARLFPLHHAPALSKQTKP